MPYVPNTPWVDGSGGVTPLSAARLNNMEAGISPTYMNYTPTWTSSGVAPAIGNATVVARYVQIGKFVHAQFRVVFGTTSSYGTGTYAFALPVTASTDNSVLGTGRLLDDSTGNLLQPIAYLASASTCGFLYPATYLGVSAVVTESAPWTWAVSDLISVSMTYEAA